VSEKLSSKAGPDEDALQLEQLQTNLQLAEKRIDYGFLSIQSIFENYLD